MGSDHEDMASIYETGNSGQLNFQQFQYRYEVETESADNPITDSAASATAYASGVEVNNGVVSRAIPGDGGDLETILDFARKNGYVTAVLTTSEITHATPAAFLAHADSRYDTSEIGVQIEEGGVNYLFGGGSSGISLFDLEQNDYSIITSLGDFQYADHLAYIYGETHLPYEVDRFSGEPTLASMTRYLLKIFTAKKIEKAFVVLEGARIDHASHINDTERALGETLGLARAVGEVVRWSYGKEGCRVIVTADHETGDLSIISNLGKGKIPEVEWGRTGHTAENVSLYSNIPLDSVSRFENERVFDILKEQL